MTSELRPPTRVEILSDAEATLALKSAASSPITVMVVDDHAVVRSGLAA